jgi:hypothetical protein
MNSASVKLFLTLLWLVPGVALLVHDLTSGRAIARPFGRWQVPLAWLCLSLAAFNFVHWYVTRSWVKAPSWFNDRRRHREPVVDEPDPNFRFEEPPDAPRRET